MEQQEGNSFFTKRDKRAIYNKIAVNGDECHKAQ